MSDFEWCLAMEFRVLQEFGKGPIFLDVRQLRTRMGCSLEFLICIFLSDQWSRWERLMNQILTLKFWTTMWNVGALAPGKA